MKSPLIIYKKYDFNVIYAKERNMSEYINFSTYQDNAIIQRPLRYYRRRGQPHPQPKGDLH